MSLTSLQNDPQVDFGKVTISLSANINPSEDMEKVREALSNIIPMNYSFDGRMLKARTQDLEALTNVYEKIRAKRSLGVLRRLLLRGMGDDSSTILLNRQAAYVGSVVFCETEMEGPLGPLTLVVKADKIMNFIDWLAPH
ncbi:MAG: RNA-binding domain-containing protein [Nitrososphaerales archaeon]